MRWQFYIESVLFHFVCSILFKNLFEIVQFINSISISIIPFNLFISKYLHSSIFDFCYVFFISSNVLEKKFFYSIVLSSLWPRIEKTEKMNSSFLNWNCLNEIPLFSFDYEFYEISHPSTGSINISCFRIWLKWIKWTKSETESWFILYGYRLWSAYEALRTFFISQSIFEMHEK